MKLTTRSILLAGAGALAVAVSGLLSSTASAAIVYGDFGPVGGFTITDVVESSATDPVPLYDADGVVNDNGPTPFVVGVRFRPAMFGANAAGGGADVTDGQLNFGVQGGPIQSISFSERGDYSLFGTGTAVTRVGAGIGATVKVTHIDGVDLLNDNNPSNDNIVISGNASVAFNLLANAGITEDWSLGLTIDINGGLTSQGVSFVNGATQVEVFLNDTLLAISEPASIALIVKKDFVVTVNPVIPEPSTFALASLALCGAVAGVVRKRR